MKDIPERFRKNIEDISELLTAIHEDRNNIKLIKSLKNHLETLIENVETENIKEKLKLLKKKIILLEKNIEVCSEDFLEESFYLLSYIKKLK